MMRIGFFHDHFFYRDKNNIHTTGSLDSNLWGRYLLSEDDELIVCARQKESNNFDHGRMASRPQVSFVFSPSLSSFRALINPNSDVVVRDVVKSVDVVVARLPSEIGFSAIKYAIKFHKKVICEVVGCPYDSLKSHDGMVAKIYAPVIKRRMKSFVGYCDAALYVTKYELQKRYPNKKLNVSASNVEIFSTEVESIEARCLRFRERRHSGTIKIGLIGTLDNSLKGIEVAIKSIGDKPCSLHVIGQGDSSKYESLSKKLSVSFFYDGFKREKNDVISWLDDIDIYIQPSFQEGLPRATIEAMSRGCPVVSSTAGGLSELVLKEFVHKPGDYKKLSTDIEKILKEELSFFESLIKHSLSVADNYQITKLEARRKNFFEEAYSSC